MRHRQPAPRQRLDARFVRAIRASGHGIIPLASLAGYAAYFQLSAALNHEVAVTPQSIARLRAVASAVGYIGPLFMEASC